LIGVNRTAVHAQVSHCLLMRGPRGRR